LLRRWFQQLSLARVADLAKRLHGACVNSVTASSPRPPPPVPPTTVPAPVAESGAGTTGVG
jgi:hypothetical protein